MDLRKEYGKIQSVSFGHGGYQDAMIGIHFTLSGDGWGVGDTKSIWDPYIIKRTERHKWTEKDRDRSFAEIVRYISALLRDAKVDSVEKLKGIPVEVLFEGNTLKEWRIFTEVL